MTPNQLNDIVIEDLLPHRGRMLLISEILFLEPDYGITAATVHKSWPLAGEDGVQPLVLIELAAQTAGVYNSWQNLRDKETGSETKGWLVAIKQTEFFIHNIPFAEKIITRAENTHQYDLLREISSTMHLADQLIGRVTLQVIQAQEND